MKKKLLVVAAAMMMVFSMAGCGAKQDAPINSNQGTEQPKEMTEEEYVAAVKEKAEAIEAKSQELTESMGSVDQTDLKAVVDTTTKMAEELKPFYEELANLKAPEKFADAQKKITDGAQAAADALDMSIELMKISMEVAEGGEEAAKETQTKLTDLSTKVTELQGKAADMEAGLAEVLGE